MAVAAIAVLSSCSSEDDYNDSPKDGGAFYATVEDRGPRTTLGTGDDANKVFWSSGDKISVNGTECTLTDGDGTTHATFEGGSVSGTPYKAYYPASLYNGGTPTLPATQTYEEGTISNLPMYAQSNDHNLVFKNLCGVLAITVNSSDFSSVSSIEISSDQQMNGAFTATADGTLTFETKTLSADDKKVTLNFASAKTISSSETFYIAVPANAAHNFIIKVTGDSKTKAMATQAASGISVVRNTVYPITFAENAVQLWAGGPYWATVNVGATIADYASANGSTNALKYTTANVGGLYRWCGTNNMRESLTLGDDHYTGATYSSDYDTAKKLWGYNWQMPTSAQLTSLKNTTNCTWTYCSGSAGSQYVSGCTLAGWKVSGKTGTNYASNSIFLPLAGYFSHNYPTSLRNEGAEEYYWSSTENGSTLASRLYLTTSSQDVNNQSSRSFGWSVRAILTE